VLRKSADPQEGAGRTVEPGKSHGANHSNPGAASVERPGRDRLESALSSSYLPSLDGLRTCCVFMVIVFHFGIAASPAGLGVLGFFVLSGFLITWLLLKEQDRTGSVSITGFYRRRFFRIFPAFYCFWFLSIALLVVRSHPVPWPHALSAFAYVSDYYSALAHPPASYYSHTWSLAIEEQFYMLWPVAVYLVGKNLRLLNRVVLLVIGAVWLYRPLLRLGFGVSQSYIYNAFDTRVDHIMIGCLLAVILKRRLLPALWDWLYSHRYVSVVTLALLVASVAASYLDRTALYRDLVGFMVDPVLVALLLVQTIMGAGSAWLQTGVMKYLGRISYSLYLYQQITLYPVRVLCAGLPMLLQLLVAVAFTVAVASASYYAIERPFLRRKARTGSDVVRRKGATAGSEPAVAFPAQSLAKERAL
jgi:peptidoglycan/LPS O-acetylase OafA/YrhL